MIKDKKIFFSTRKLSGPYQFLVEATKAHSEKLINQKLTLSIHKNHRFDIISIFYLIKIIFKTHFFSKKKIMSVKHHGYNLGRYAVPEIYKNYNSYLNKSSFIVESIKCFYLNIKILRNIIKLKKNNIRAAFIDHGMYRNGLIISVLAKKKIPIYTLGYPKGILYFINKKKKFLDYENLIQLKKIKKLNNTQIKQAKASIIKVIHKTETIPWMKTIKFVKPNNNFDEITHVIYAHSFTDGQMLYGYDDFVNVYDWLEYSIDLLIKNKSNRVLVKAHPSFFHSKFPNKIMRYDIKLFHKIMTKYANNRCVHFIKKPIKNIDLLNQVDKKTILISHHGSAILEGLFLNFKCIASQATFWSPTFKLTNDWKNKISYKNLLTKDWLKLKHCNQKDLYSICYQLFCNPLGLYGKHYWQQTLSDELNITRKQIYQRSAYILDRANLEKKDIQKLALKISKTIELVKI
tara:strand:+ start:1167 stop:2549 length:1383 start_codon:yes stop_codon:yes gene_type:complete